jgi:hypothetical protein
MNPAQWAGWALFLYLRRTQRCAWVSAMPEPRRSRWRYGSAIRRRLTSCDPHRPVQLTSRGRDPDPPRTFDTTAALTSRPTLGANAAPVQVVGPESAYYGRIGTLSEALSDPQPSMRTRPAGDPCKSKNLQDGPM